MPQQDVAQIEKVSLADIEPNTRRGGELRVVLGPKTAGATSGFMGVLDLAPGEYVSEHYHPYSEEYLYVVSGSMRVRVDGAWLALSENEGVMVPVGVRHRVENNGTEPGRAVFHLSPLAPEPRLGHVDTEPVPSPEIDHQKITNG